MSFSAADTIIGRVAEGELQPGETKKYSWKVGRAQAVYSFSVHPAHEMGQLTQVEVKNVQSQTLGNPPEMKVTFEVHNFGAWWCHFAVYMSVVTPVA